MIDDELKAIEERSSVVDGETIPWEHFRTVVHVCSSDVPKLIAEVRRLRVALEYYADTANYPWGNNNPNNTPISIDQGERARNALECSHD